MIPRKPAIFSFCLFLLSTFWLSSRLNAEEPVIPKPAETAAASPVIPGETADQKKETPEPDSVIRRHIYEFPLTYREKPLGYSQTPFGYQEKHLGFVPEIPGTNQEPLGLSLNPPGFIEKAQHPNINANPSFRLSPENHPLINTNPSFRQQPRRFGVKEEESSPPEEV